MMIPLRWPSSATISPRSSRIVYFVDLIYDYYESRGYLSDDDADDEEPIEIDEDELVDYVVRNAQKDGVGKFDPDQIRFVVQGELEYCESINLFD